MSKTVKRVMTVMMVGLVAMLGAKAEAHWVNVGGRCVWHSFECSRMDTNRPPPPDNPLPFVELLATPIHGQVLCPGTPPVPKDIGLTEPMRTRRTQLTLSDITQLQDPVSGDAISTSEWQRIISDAFFWRPVDQHNPTSGDSRRVAISSYESISEKK